jgi:vancomycin resistance protein YoaR
MLLGLTGGMTVVAAHWEARIRPNTFAGPVDVGGLTELEARFKLRQWWETERRRPVELRNPRLVRPLSSRTPGRLGVTLDDEATIRQLPLEGMVDQLGGGETPRTEYGLVYSENGQSLTDFRAEVAAAAPVVAPARISFSKGVVSRRFETARLALDEEQLFESVVDALETGEPVQVPVKEGEKRIPDRELLKIREPISSFSTRFSGAQVSRSANIRLAASKLDGLILLPGEKFSFNEVVGRRTVDRGYREAGIYVNGRHDTGIGGGICQVSTTLYNAVLVADLRVLRRSNHSMPVPYVPVGRDAAVSYGALDLSFENNLETPVAISSLWAPGRLTVRILGTKTPGQTVRIAVSDHRSWERGVKTVVDPALRPGKTKVIEKGSRGFSAVATRIVTRNGVVVRREVVNRSHYVGGPKIIAVGPVAKPASVAQVRSSAQAPTARG